MEQLMQNQVFVIVLLVWSLIWKGLALWRAACRREKIWFVVFMVLNLIGIPEIIYLIVTKKNKEISNP